MFMMDSAMVDLKEVENFIESDKFVQFLLSNTTNIGTPLFILQAVKDKVNELKNNEESE